MTAATDAGSRAPQRRGGPLRRFWRSTRASSTVEFVIVFPLFIYMLCLMAESGTLMLRQVMLDRALDITVRQLRIRTWDTPTQAILKSSICSNAWATNCSSNLMLELTPIPQGTALPSASATCVDRNATVQPVTTFDGGTQNEMMLVRACLLFDPLFPSYGLGLQLAKNSNGAYALVATSAFVNEPDS